MKKFPEPPSVLGVGNRAISLFVRMVHSEHFAACLQKVSQPPWRQAVEPTATLTSFWLSVPMGVSAMTPVPHPIHCPITRTMLGTKLPCKGSDSINRAVLTERTVEGQGATPPSSSPLG